MDCEKSNGSGSGQDGIEAQLNGQLGLNTEDQAPRVLILSQPARTCHKCGRAIPANGYDPAASGPDGRRGLLREIGLLACEFCAKEVRPPMPRQAEVQSEQLSFDVPNIFIP